MANESTPAPVLEQESPPTTSPRLVGIDFVRVLAVCAIVTMHTFPASGALDSLGTWVNQCCRWAVPFFFVAAGFFFEKGLLKGRSAKTQLLRSTRRLLGLFVLWWIVYLFAPPGLRDLIGPERIGAWTQAIAFRWGRVTGSLELFLLEGPAIHLWFLVALWGGLLFVVATRGHRKPDVMLAIALLLYVIGVLGGTYSATPAGLNLPIHTRNGIFFSAFFTAVGVMLAQREHLPGLRGALLLFVAGMASHICEVIAWSRIEPLPLWENTFTLGTLVWGVGAFLVARTLPAVGPVKQIARLAGLPLGIYLTHMIFADPVYCIAAKVFGDGPLYNPSCPAGVLLCAGTATYILSLNRFTRRLIS
ncbi:MAG: acyltransferase family protein [Lentisphaerae bacterium]|jgi:surface polysaccharide O-acyltransferase-like enzyme|nr:acyltransferase family protein [Lentisphaerota bacterium]MBT4817630.1 acyltransferase family protein [Lentisphaerota bacterium]MBT5605374.1 acyltransferase family protein [Lentisphaerota bacterium]MBT7060379.1 acyltransferase family protein [Lentisphaerota bacterium]MBT7844767.1 acyltransferase family protein [Lentisphaerota bacterium]